MSYKGTKCLFSPFAESSEITGGLLKVCETAGFPRVASQLLPLSKVGSQVGRFSRVFTRVWTFPWVGSQTCWDGLVDIYIGLNGLS